MWPNCCYVFFFSHRVVAAAVIMSHFGFENDIHNVLRLDMPITNAPMARWQRKASTSNSTNTNSLSPNKSVNRSASLSKTPSKTPGKSRMGPAPACCRVGVSSVLHNWCLQTGKNGKTQNTPSKAGGDRFIPTRNNKQLDVASFLISKENEPVEETASSTAVRYKKLY